MQMFRPKYHFSLYALEIPETKFVHPDSFCNTGISYKLLLKMYIRRVLITAYCIVPSNGYDLPTLYCQIFPQLLSRINFIFNYLFLYNILSS
jgi:hypothetical protein